MIDPNERLLASVTGKSLKSMGKLKSKRRRRGKRRNMTTKEMMHELDLNSDASFKNESTDSEVSEMVKEMKRNDILSKARGLVSF